MTVEANNCHSCQQRAVVDMLDCGAQPICNRFPIDPFTPEATFPLTIGQCAACGLIQVTHPAPVEELRPRVDWISYNEPEEHLDKLVDELVCLPGMTRQSLVGAVVFGGDTTIERFQQRGFQRTWRIDLRRDLGISENNSGTETIQKCLTPEAAMRIVQQHGQLDMVVVRHMVEHTHNVRTFLKAMLFLLKPGGYAAFEVPDCEPSFVTCDYSIIWEEHVFYFMPVTFQQCLTTAGFEVMTLERPSHSLVAITRASTASQQKSVLSDEMLEMEKARMKLFADSLPERRKAVGAVLSERRARNGRIAFFGAGHLACVYINLLQLKEHLDCIVDDHPGKRGLFLPGSRLPIVSSEELANRHIAICLSALSSETEEKVISRNPQFTANGGRFLSIFAGRPNSLLP